MKITLVEFDVGTPWNRYQITLQNTEVLWVNYAPGVWVTSPSGDFTPLDADLVGASFTWYGTPALEPAGSTEGALSITRVGSVFVNNSRLPDAGGLPALLDALEAAFYWDETDELLYVKFPFDSAPGIFDIVIGIATLASNKQWTDELNARIYDPVLASLPQVTKSIDPLFFGRIQYNDANIELINSHGEFDGLADFDVYGQEVRILYGDSADPYVNFRRMWTGYIDDFTLSENTVSIRASDSRKLLEKPIPVSFFSVTDYANLNDRDEGKPIPIAYGKVVGANPMCVDKDLDRTIAADYTFVLCDVSEHTGIASVDEVRYKGEVITPVTTTIATATIVLDDTDIEDANGRVDFRDVEVDFTGLTDSGGTIQDGLNVIVDLLATYGQIPFSTIRYNVTEWNALTVADVGLYIDKDTTIAQAIERIAASLRIQFDVQGDGRFTARAFDPLVVPTITIRPDEILTPITATYTSEEFASRLYVNYIGGVLRYTTDEATIINRYKTTKPAEFDTVLTSELDATEFAEDIMSLVKDFPPLISVTTKIGDELNIEDNVYAILNRIVKRWFGRMICRVESVQYDFDSEEVTYGLRAFESVDDEGVIIYSQGFGVGFLGFSGVLSETQYPEI